ncbi:MAG: hypothetical protein U1A78_35260 [Polyangia bacterium]
MAKATGKAPGKVPGGVKDGELDALYQAPLEEFTAQRNAAAAEMKRRGRTEAAKALRARKKPSVSAWTVNQLFFREPEAWARLSAAGEALRQAYANLGSGGTQALHRGQATLRQVLAALQDKAQRLLEKDGRAATSATLARIGSTLHALALRAPDDTVRAGRLSADVDPPGLEALTGDPADAAASPRSARPFRTSPSRKPERPAPSRTRPPRARAKKDDRDTTRLARARSEAARLAAERQTERERARAELARLREQRDAHAQGQRDARAALRSAEQELSRCSRAAAEAERRVAAARRELSAAEAEQGRAERAEQEARARAERARRTVEEAERRASTVERELAARRGRR